MDCLVVSNKRRQQRFVMSEVCVESAVWRQATKIRKIRKRVLEALVYAQLSARGFDVIKARGVERFTLE